MLAISDKTRPLSWIKNNSELETLPMTNGEVYFRDDIQDKMINLMETR